ncbi:hypothetical protein [Pedobacter agri]|uniref:Uncharacterized protein n=1 Tax=Pedobacter agri TaxID=454586 RepID=A0A9X3IB02_9SPHI|nr:hypothetical protein [Pedobacter agri]MCX3267462.1 hypothetical protein [Pedobacter agri]
MDQDINNAFVKLRKPSRANFNEIFENYSIVFENQMDSIRKEIILCIVHDLHQAAIMLTNHLLEKFLRAVIVIEESGIEKMIPENQKKIKTAYKNRRSSSLNDLNDEALKRNIISEVQHQQIKEYILTIRNPYSHGSSFQILKDEKPIKTLSGSFSEGIKSEIIETDINSYFPLQSLFQEIRAMKDSVKYFKFVDAILYSFYKEKNEQVFRRQF